MPPYNNAPYCREVRYVSTTCNGQPAVSADWKDDAGRWHPIGKAWPNRIFPPFSELFQLIREHPSYPKR